MYEVVKRRLKRCRIIIACLFGFLALWLLGCFVWLADVSWFGAFLIIFIPFLVVQTINNWILYFEMPKEEKKEDVDDDFLVIRFKASLASFCIYTVVAMFIMIHKDIAGIFLSIVNFLLAIIILVATYIPLVFFYLRVANKAQEGDVQGQYDIGIFLMKRYQYGAAIFNFEKSAAQGHTGAALKLEECRKKVEELNREKDK